MTVQRNFEGNIEAAFVTLLGTNTDLSAVTKRKWRDGSLDKTFPIILVHCGNASNILEDATLQGGLYECSITFIIATYNKDDRNKNLMYNYTGAVRDSLSVSNLLTLIKTLYSSITPKALLPTGGDIAIGESNINMQSLEFSFHFQK